LKTTNRAAVLWIETDSIPLIGPINLDVGGSMTICISALCENRRKVVAMADRISVVGQMGHPFTIQREGAVNKMRTCASRTLLMASGATNCSEWVVDRLKEWGQSRETMTVHDVYHEVKKLARKMTTKMRTQFVRANLGVNWSFSELAKTISTSSAGTHINAWNTAMQTNSGDFLVSGVEGDAEDGAGSIYHVVNAVGTPADTISDKVDHFWAIGCGARHATEVLESFNYDASWPLQNAVYALYCAKRYAELSPGVDKDCDIRIITTTGIHSPDGRLLENLKNTYEAEWARRKEQNAYPAISEAIRTLALG
jgi:hypothetical protein